MIDTDRHAAFEQLLAQPDPADLRTEKGIGRGHRLTYDGDPSRRQGVLLPLLTRWAQHELDDVDWEPIVIVRTKRGLVLQKRAS